MYNITIETAASYAGKSDTYTIEQGGNVWNFSFSLVSIRRSIKTGNYKTSAGM